MMNRLARNYFFGGLIVITISAIFLSIVVDMLKTANHVEPILLVGGIIGISVGVMAVWLALDVFFFKKKQPPPASKLEEQRGKIGFGKKVLMPLGRSLIQSAVCTVVITFLLPRFYGEDLLETTGIQYSGLILVVVLVFTLILKVSMRAIRSNEPA
jgi:MFS family permease